MPLVALPSAPPHAASPAAMRTGMTSGERPGMNEVTTASVPLGLPAAWKEMKNPTTSSTVVGVITLARSSCRLTRDAAAANTDA